MNKQIVILSLVVLAVASIFLITNLKQPESSTGFVVLVDGKQVQAPEQSYPERNTAMSQEYAEAMAKTLVEHNK